MLPGCCVIRRCGLAIRLSIPIVLTPVAFRSGRTAAPLLVSRRCGLSPCFW
jgi:hypothetical protein